MLYEGELWKELFTLDVLYRDLFWSPDGILQYLCFTLRLDVEGTSNRDRNGPIIIYGTLALSGNDEGLIRNSVLNVSSLHRGNPIYRYYELSLGCGNLHT